jgi:hypothetical protein
VRELLVGDWVALSYDTDRAFRREQVLLGAFDVSGTYGCQKTRACSRGA